MFVHKKGCVSPRAQQLLVDQGILIFEFTPSNLVGLLWTSDQPRRRDLYLSTHNTHKRHTIRDPRRDSNPKSKQSSECRPKSCTDLRLVSANGRLICGFYSEAKGILSFMALHRPSRHSVLCLLAKKLRTSATFHVTFV
jgi:hypothetical protein